MKKKTHISQIRFNYKKSVLDIKNSDLDPFKQFNKWMNEAIKYAFFIVGDGAMMDPMMVTVTLATILLTLIPNPTM